MLILSVAPSLESLPADYIFRFVNTAQLMKSFSRKITILFRPKMNTSLSRGWMELLTIVFVICLRDSSAEDIRVLSSSHIWVLLMIKHFENCGCCCQSQFIVRSKVSLSTVPPDFQYQHEQTVAAS